MSLPKAEDMQARAEQAFDEGKRGVPPANDVARKPDTAADVDEETRVLGVCVDALGKLDDVAQTRVLLYLARRYGVDVG